MVSETGSMVDMYISNSSLTTFSVKVKWGADYTVSDNTTSVEWIAMGV